MKKHPAMQAFILGGGKSRRLKRDKAFLLCEGRYFIDIAIERCSSLFGSVHLVGRQYEHPALAGCMDDEIQGVGPLGGILTALGSTAASMNFFVGIDYPLINGEIVSRLAEEAVRQHEDGKLGLIPIMPDGPHPLFAFYAKDCASAVRRCIETGSLRVQCIAAHNPICYFDMMEMQQGLGPRALQRNFINVNHVHDLKKIT